MSQNRAETARRWSTRRAILTGGLTLLVLVGGLGTWSVLTRLTGAVIAMGQIGVEQNRQIVQHPDGGVVSEILVREGDTVAEGDLLIRLDSEALSSELAVVEGQLFEVLARKARMEAERDGAEGLQFNPLLTESANPVVPELIEGQLRLHEARRETNFQQKEQLARRREQIGDQIDGISAQQAATRTQLDLIGQELASQQSLLDRGLAQASAVLNLKREEANLMGRLGELTATSAQAEGRITEIDIEILRIDTDLREEAITRLRDLQFNEIELSERRRALLTRLDRLDVRAPVSGIVYDMQIFAPRSVVRPAEPVMFLVPQDRALVITAQIEPIHIDQVFVGQEVELRFSAFDQRQTPELTGHVVTISPDAFTDQTSRMSFYRAQIMLNDGEAAKLPAGMAMIPGMPVEAFIRTGERSPLTFLMKPLMDYLAKAFRES